MSSPEDSNQRLLEQLHEISVALKQWKDQIVLGGGVALIVYDQCMAKSDAKPTGTTDLDFLIPRKPIIPARAAPISEKLEEIGFMLRTKDQGNPPIQSFVKDEGSLEIEIEFLTDARSRSSDTAVAISGAKVVAQPLSYLEMSLESVTSATLPTGLEIKIVTPEAWVFHKGLTFTKRKPGSFKRVKDLYGIWFVLTQMGDFSTLTEVRLRALQKEQPTAWGKTFSTNLSTWVSQASRREWEQLMSQDPSQRITEAGIRGLFTRLSGPSK